MMITSKIVVVWWNFRSFLWCTRLFHRFVGSDARVHEIHVVMDLKLSLVLCTEFSSHSINSPRHSDRISSRQNSFDLFVCSSNWLIQNPIFNHGREHKFFPKRRKRVKSFSCRFSLVKLARLLKSENISSLNRVVEIWRTSGSLRNLLKLKNPNNRMCASSEWNFEMKIPHAMPFFLCCCSCSTNVEMEYVENRTYGFGGEGGKSDDFAL